MRLLENIAYLLGGKATPFIFLLPVFQRGKHGRPKFGTIIHYYPFTLGIIATIIHSHWAGGKGGQGNGVEVSV